MLWEREAITTGKNVVNIRSINLTCGVAFSYFCTNAEPALKTVHIRFVN